MTRAWAGVGLLAILTTAPGSAVAGGSAANRSNSPAEATKAIPASVPSAPALPSAKDVSSCRKLPAGRRIFKLNLKPETSLADLVAWISVVTCKAFIVPSGLAADSRKVTIYAPEAMTTEEAYQLFLGALDSAGLTVYHDGRFLRVIEVARAKTSPIPLCVPSEGGGDRCSR